MPGNGLKVLSKMLSTGLEVLSRMPGNGLKVLLKMPSTGQPELLKMQSTGLEVLLRMPGTGLLVLLRTSVSGLLVPSRTSANFSLTPANGLVMLPSMSGIGQPMVQTGKLLASLSGKLWEPLGPSTWEDSSKFLQMTDIGPETDVMSSKISKYKWKNSKKVAFNTSPISRQLELVKIKIMKLILKIIWLRLTQT